jgi:hypothetical protein
VLAGSYSFPLQTADGFLLYSNRTLGPDLAFTAQYLTTNISATPQSASYNRSSYFNWSATYPILWTYSTLSPSVGFNLQQATGYTTTSNFSNSTLAESTLLAPSLDETLSFSNVENSNLGVVPEAGRLTQIGLRTYLFSDRQIWKGFFLDREYFRLTNHTILSPSIKGLWASGINLGYPLSAAVTAGRGSQSVISPFYSDNLNQITIRGYPYTIFYPLFSSVAALDLTFPILRIFGGWGANPLFLDNLYGFVFGETSYLTQSGQSALLPSAGGGLRLSSELFSNLFTTFSLELHQGFAQTYGGTTDFFFQVFLSALNI